MHTHHRRGLLFALLGAMSGGAFVIPWKLASENGDRQSMVLVMLVVAALFNTLLLRPTRRENMHPPESKKLLVGLGALFAVLTLAGNTATAEAISRLSAPMVSVLLRSDVLITAVLGWFWIGEPLQRRFVVGASVSGLGLWIALSPDPQRVQDLLGVAVCLTAAVAFSVMGVSTRKHIQAIHPLALNALRLWLSVLLWFALHGLPDWAQLNPAVVIYSSLAAIVGPGVGRLALMYSARDLPAKWTALMGLTGPVWAVLFSALWLHHFPTPKELLGGTILLGGIMLALPSAAKSR